MFKHNSHPKRSRRNAVDLTSDLTEHPNVSSTLSGRHLSFGGVEKVEICLHVTLL